jgi:hypothetical protein
MPSKAGATKRASKVIETLSSAASMFQVPNMNVLATNTGLPIDLNDLTKDRRDGAHSPVRYIGRPSTIMCPW